MIIDKNNRENSDIMKIKIEIGGLHNGTGSKILKGSRNILFGNSRRRSAKS